jgi:hypothetical protein
MSTVTYCVILPFVRNQDGELIGIEAIEAASRASVTARAAGRSDEQ